MNLAVDRYFFLYEPGNEYEVCLLFGFLLPYLEGEWVLDEYTDNYPDSTFLVGGKAVRVEFELYSANFVDHGHDPEKCDMIVCWKDNWPNCPLEIIELSLIMDARNLRGLIKNRCTKYQVTQWTLAEFLESVRQHRGAGDMELLKGFFRRLEDNSQVRYIPGRGKRGVTMKIYVKDLSEKMPLIGIHSTPESLWAWIDYQPLEHSNDALLPNLRDFFREPDKKWHNVMAETTAGLIEKIEAALRIMKGTA
jgi:hypothetical protein